MSNEKPQVMVELDPELSGRYADVYWFTIDGGVMGDGGQLEAAFSGTTGEFTISSILVAAGARRQGLGTALAESALEKAQELEAIEINADLMSQEVIPVMRRVFGSDAVVVMDEGSPIVDPCDPPYDAKATLLVKLADSNTSGKEKE